MSDTKRREPDPQWDDECNEDRQAEIERGWQDFQARCAREAERLTDDPLLRKVFQFHLFYSYGHTKAASSPKPYEPSSHPFEKDGIKFFVVGHNASHQFYLGVKDGVLYRGSYDCDCDNYDEPDSGFAYSAVESNSLRGEYLGHL